MKQALLALALLTSFSASAFAMGTVYGGSRGCEAKTYAVGVGAYATCNGQGGTSSPEYKTCAAKFITNYMIENGCATTDYKKAYPNIFN